MANTTSLTAGSVPERTAGRFAGQKVLRKEDPRLLTGGGHYIDDVVLKEMLHATFVRSDVARARITRLDVDAARNSLTSTTLDYLIPTSAEIPDVECHHIETAATTPGGFKGVGEGGAIGAPPAVFNAVADALAQVRATVTDQPLDPSRVLAAIRKVPS